MIKVEAYKCEWCGQIFINEHGHMVECKYDPKARTCISCGFGNELIKDYDNKATGAYCPRRNKVFLYPHGKYCPDYIPIEGYEAYKK